MAHQSDTKELKQINKGSATLFYHQRHGNLQKYPCLYIRTYTRTNVPWQVISPLVIFSPMGDTRDEGVYHILLDHQYSSEIDNKY